MKKMNDPLLDFRLPILDLWRLLRSFIDFKIQNPKSKFKNLFVLRFLEPREVPGTVIRPFILSSLVLLLSCGPAFAGEKSWSGKGDQSDWQDENNWAPEGYPGSDDTVTVNNPNASAKATETFAVKSLNIGAQEESSVTTEEFVSGTIDPRDASGDAVVNQRFGVFRLRGGAGTVKLKGSYKDSEEDLSPQPSFMFVAE